MKKLLLAMLALSAAGQMTAQSFHKASGLPSFSEKATLSQATEANKGTAIGDTIKGRLNFSVSQLTPDSLASYRVGTAPYDSGYVFGTNPYGDKGFAERFEINGNDSSVKVIGTYAIFDGRYNPSTTKSINLRVWAQGGKALAVAGRPHLFYDGFPTTVLTTQSVSIKNLGIDQTSANDSAKYFPFATPTLNIKDTFYVGYDMAYTFNSLNGDTITVKSTRDGYKYVPLYYVQGADTLLLVKNAAQYSDNSWHDLSEEDFTLDVHLCFFPVFVVRGLGVDGISNKGLIFHCAYPNPAATSSNVNFELKNAGDVTIQIADMTGRIISTQKHGSLSTGAHTLPVNVESLANGNYICLIHTSNGDGMGVQITVAH